MGGRVYGEGLASGSGAPAIGGRLQLFDTFGSISTVWNVILQFIKFNFNI